MDLTDEEIDVLKELFNVGVGRAAGTLNEMLSSRVTLQVPSVKVFKRSEMNEEIEEAKTRKVSSVDVTFQGTLTGLAALIFPPDSASKLVAMLAKEESENTDLDAIRAGTLTEVGNIILNGVMGTFSNMLKQQLNFSIPTYKEDVVSNLLSLNGNNPEEMIILARAHFKIEEHLIEGDVILLFEVRSFDVLLSSIDNVIETSL